MGDFIIPIILVVLGLVFAFNTYRNIRRGGARHYTLEREAVLRRATGTLLISTLFLVGATGYMIFTAQASVPDVGAEPAAGDVTEATPEATPAGDEAMVESVPRDQVDPPTPFPTATPTQVLVRGMIEGTGGSGLSLRTEPSTTGDTITIIPDGSIVTILNDDPVQADTFTWVRIRTIANEEGWVAEQFLIMRDQ